MLPLSNLKPVFYRVGEALEIHSGWIDPETGDIWDTVYDNQMTVKVVPGAYPAFKVGQRVEFTKADSTLQHTFWEASEPMWLTWRGHLVRLACS